MQIPSLSGRVAVAARSVLLAAAFLLVAAGALAAQPLSAPLAPAPSTLALHAASSQSPPMRLAEGFGVEPLARMSAARVGAVDQLEALAAHNRAGMLPLQVGFERPLPVPRSVRLHAMAGEAAGVHAGGVFARGTPSTTVWGASVRVEGAYRLRLHLADVELPVGARLWVYAEDGEAVGPFGLELAYEGELLTPSVAGPAIHLEVELPRGAADDGIDYGFRIDRVAQIFGLGPSGEPLPDRFGGIGSAPAPAHADCLVDASCVGAETFEVVDLVGSALALLQFPDAGGIFICTGGLLNTVPGEDVPAPTPPLLTANHCFSNQSAASGLEMYWDFSTPSCNAEAPSLDTLPRTNGAILLETGPESDFTLVAPTVPEGRTLLGWTAEPSATVPGTTVHRVSFPVPHGVLIPQSYSRYETLAPDDSRFQECTAGEGQDIQDTSKFLHLQPLQGGTYGGSSGAPSMLGNGQVVGQLFGGCPGADGCDPVNNDIDGAFQTTFDRIAPYLIGGLVPPPPSSDWLTTAEQPGFEFQVRITPPGKSSLVGTKIPESACIAETLCATGVLAHRPEVLVRIIGPRPNGFLWVQVSRLTPSQIEVWVQRAGGSRVNYYVLDPLGPGQDRMAFTP